MNATMTEQEEMAEAVRQVLARASERVRREGISHEEAARWAEWVLEREMELSQEATG